MRGIFAARVRGFAARRTRPPRPGRRLALALGALAVASALSTPAASAVEGDLDPAAATSAAIDDLRFAQQQYPPAAAALEEIIGRLQRSLEGAAGEPLFVDSCHAVPHPGGLTPFVEARQAVLQIGALLDQAARNNPQLPLPPFVRLLLEDVRASVVGAYQFLADAAVQEARARGRGAAAGTQIGLAERNYAAALADLAGGDHVKAMQSLRQAWEHAQLALPAAVAEEGAAPLLSISDPQDGSTLFAAPITVAGMVQDATSGTVDGDDVQVAVNGVAAAVVNRSFQAVGVPLREGLNALIAVATDTDGNVTTACLAVALDTRPRARIGAVSGNLQTARIGTLLPAPFVVQVTDAAGQPAAGAQVVFRVFQGNGTLDGGERAVLVTADAQGRAAAALTLGSRAGAGVDLVRATAVGFAGEVVFSATATAGDPTSINAVSGDNQFGGVGQELPLPLVAVVIDEGQNPLSGVPVTFEVLAGDGTVGGAASLVVATDSNGRAAASLTLGPADGLDNNLVEARFAGLASEPATFKASGRVLGDPAQTRISGVVLDNQGDAVPGVTMHLHGGGPTATTDAEGQFVLTGVPVGKVFLIADASTATRPGTWASLEFELHTLPGVDNILPRPIYILPLDLENGKVAGGPEDVTITVPAVPGFSLTVLAGSATFGGGARTGLVSVTAVHSDKIPMPPGSGMQPRFIVSIQPPDVHFDPPAPVAFPNVDALPPGTLTEMFSFDHDLGEFVSIGTGTVTEDGLAVRSDPGFGIVKGGWHCAAPASGSGGGGALSVKLSPRPIKVQYGSTTSVSAAGRPPRDGEYRNWRVLNKNVDNELKFTAQPTCPGATSCTNTLEAKELPITNAGHPPAKVCGTAQAEVTFFCTTTNKSVKDTVTIEQGCAGKDAAACRNICTSQKTQGMCGTPCDLIGVTPPAFDPNTMACWTVNVGGTDFCYWDLFSPTGPGFVNLCCPNRCSGGSFQQWRGTQTGQFLCTVPEACPGGRLNGFLCTDAN